MAPIRVAIVNDYEVVVRGLAAMLTAYRDAFEIVELDAGTGVGQTVDLALYDTFAATAGDGEDVRALAQDPRVGKVVVYAWDLSEHLVSSAFAGGAQGYISKGLPAHDLVEAMRAIHAGTDLVHPIPAGSMTAIVGDWPGRSEGLSHRESEVLALITQGLSNAEIAERTRLSINSIKSYIRTCYRRIGVTNRANAVIWGIDHGFRPDHVRIRPVGS